MSNRLQRETIHPVHRALVAVMAAALLLLVPSTGPVASAASVTVAGSLQSEAGCAGDWDPACATTHLAYDTSDGVWQGTRLLPEGWSKFVSTLAPAWKRPVYGAQFWVNGDGAWNLPKDAYFAAGAGGQNTFIVPSHQLVIVRMGHMRGAGAARARTNEALKLIMEAVASAK